MKIGLNLLFIRSSTTGGSATYAVNLVNALSNIDKTNNYIVYLNQNCKELPLTLGRNFTKKIIPFSSTNPIKRLFLEQIIFPFYFFKENLNVLHSLGYHGPILSIYPHIVSILDLNFIRHKHMSKIHSLFLGIMVKIMTKTAKHIITISQFSKKEIVENLNVLDKNVTATLLSGSSDKKNSVSNINIKKIYNIKKKYIIAFGSNGSHKNIDQLIYAFNEIRKTNLDFQLVLVGYQHKASILSKIVYDLNLNEKVIFTGFVPFEHVFSLIKKSNLFVFPSFYEGFGIPLLDAQACGIPIASSNAGSLPEVGNTGCIYFDPADTQEMISVIKRIINNPKVANQLVSEGLKNRSNFSWNNTATETLKCYMQL
jgi:glycosyltransferase involved in cell wall biosynthesis